MRVWWNPGVVKSDAHGVGFDDRDLDSECDGVLRAALGLLSDAAGVKSGARRAENGARRLRADAPALRKGTR